MMVNARYRQRTPVVVVRTECTLVALAGALVLAWRTAAEPLRRLVQAAQPGHTRNDVRVDALVCDLASVVLLVALAALAVLLVLSTVNLLLGERGRWLSAACARVTPVACRRLVAACCGVGLATPALLASPALADLDSGQHTCHGSCAVGRVRLDGLQLPDLPTRPPAPAPRRAARTPDEDRAAEVVVRAGDSLWRIAERRLPAAASAGEIERLTNRLYTLNRSAIGADPDLIFPGMTFIAPEGSS